MIGSLSEALVSRKPRENSGGPTSNRFDFQKDWTLCKIIELHKTGSDYLVLCEVHEDITVLDSESEPRTVEFFQVKTTKETKVTLPKLLKRDKGTNGTRLPSICDKLFYTIERWRDHCKSVNLISNVCYSLTMSNSCSHESVKRFSYSTLHSDIKDQITASLREKYPETIDSVSLDSLFFEVTELSLTDHSTHAKGILADFLHCILPDRPVSVVLLYQALFHEICRKNNFEYSSSTFSELAHKKGISRSFIEQALDLAQKTYNSKSAWDEVKEQLQAELVDYTLIQHLNDCWKRYEAERTDHSDKGLQDIRDLILSTIELPFQGKLIDWAYAILDIVRARKTDITKSSDYLLAMVLRELNESTKPLSKANS